MTFIVRYVESFEVHSGKSQTMTWRVCVCPTKVAAQIVQKTLEAQAQDVYELVKGIGATRYYIRATTESVPEHVTDKQLKAAGFKLVKERRPHVR